LACILESKFTKEKQKKAKNMNNFHYTLFFLQVHVSTLVSNGFMRIFSCFEKHCVEMHGWQF
jgi:hypothetical protein